MIGYFEFRYLFFRNRFGQALNVIMRYALKMKLPGLKLQTTIYKCATMVRACVMGSVNACFSSPLMNTCISKTCIYSACLPDCIRSFKISSPLMCTCVCSFYLRRPNITMPAYFKLFDFVSLFPLLLRDLSFLECY
jgi:hypothetical protein